MVDPRGVVGHHDRPGDGRRSPTRRTCPAARRSCWAARRSRSSIRAKGSLWVVPAAGLGWLRRRGHRADRRDRRRRRCDGRRRRHGLRGLDRDGRGRHGRRRRRGRARRPVDGRALSGIDEGDRRSRSPRSATSPVVLDAASGSVLSTGGLRTEVAGARDAVLQQPSAETDAVILATAGSLVRVPFDGSEPSRSPRRRAGRSGCSGVPQGLRLRAWSGSAMFVRDCVGDDDDLTTRRERRGCGCRAALPGEPRRHRAQRHHRRRRVDGQRQTCSRSTTGTTSPRPRARPRRTTRRRPRRRSRRRCRSAPR